MALDVQHDDFPSSPFPLSFPHGLSRHESNRPLDHFLTHINPHCFFTALFLFLLSSRLSISGKTPRPAGLHSSVLKPFGFRFSSAHCRRSAPFEPHKQCRPDPREKLFRLPGERTPL